MRISSGKPLLIYKGDQSYVAENSINIIYTNQTFPNCKPYIPMSILKGFTRFKPRCTGRGGAIRGNEDGDSFGGKDSDGSGSADGDGGNVMVLWVVKSIAVGMIITMVLGMVIVAE